MTEALTKQVIPKLRESVALWLIKKMTDLAIERLETAASARKQLLRTTTREILIEIVDRVADEQAQRLEALEAETESPDVSAVFV